MTMTSLPANFPAKDARSGRPKAGIVTRALSGIGLELAKKLLTKGLVNQQPRVVFRTSHNERYVLECRLNSEFKR